MNEEHIPVCIILAPHKTLEVYIIYMLDASKITKFWFLVFGELRKQSIRNSGSLSMMS